MKLRIRGNSIRLRLMQAEVATLQEQGVITEKMQLTPKLAFAYTIRSGERTRVDLKDGELIVIFEKLELADWTGTEQVSLEATLDNGDGGLRILVEKDFACLTDRVHEDDSDAYPNPNSSC